MSWNALSQSVGRPIARGLAALLGVLTWSGAAQAGVIDEVSVGWYAHDIVNMGHGVESNLQDLQLEIDSGRPRILRFLGAPRLNVFAAANGAAHSDVFGAGLVWDHRAFWRQLRVTLDFGVGYSNGQIDPPHNFPPSDPDGRHYPRLLVGSPALFRTAPGLEWRLSDRWAVGGQFVHLSNANLLGHHRFNRGINDVGLRVGYRFH